MKNFLLLLLFSFPLATHAQWDHLPKGPSEAEKALEAWYVFTEPVSFNGTPEPPPQPVRHMAEWEELQALVVTWRSFPNILKEIVRHAKEEVPVLIVCRNESVKTQAQNTLTNSGITLENVEFVIADNNSVWIRDYGQNPVYANDVEDLYFVDWVYNRIFRPEDDAVPDAIGEHFDVPVYATVAGDDRMVNTGGNFMSDGLHNAFASRLILEENEPGNAFGAGPHEEEDIDGIMQSYMGIERFTKFETLPYDGIHHIDMHMHLVDEETILFAEYPEGVADGPQIEANIAYLQDNFMSAFGTPYRIERIISPPDAEDQYPNHPNGDYRTYTNSVFVNKTIIIPLYEEQYDTVALRIYREHFPGYKVVGIDCNEMISSLGALHCITKEVGAFDPLWIVHQRQRDIADNETWGDYPLSAQIKHRHGIANAQLFWRTDTLAGFEEIELVADQTEPDIWHASIPHQPNGTEIFYYLRGEANDGKTQVRPLAAPAGYYHFTVDGITSAAQEPLHALLQMIYPNPASAITVIPVQTTANVDATIEVFDVTGRLAELVFSGNLPAGNSNHFLQAAEYVPGTYFVRLTTETGVHTQKLVVK